MKTLIRIQEGCVEIYQESETQEESSTLMQAVNSVKKPVIAYGAVGRSHTWAWFEIPAKSISEYQSTKIGNTD